MMGELLITAEHDPWRDRYVVFQELAHKASQHKQNEAIYPK